MKRRDYSITYKKMALTKKSILLFFIFSILFLSTIQIARAEVSQAFAGGLQGVSSDLTTNVIINRYLGVSTVCEKDALGFMAAAINFKVAEDEVSLLYKSLIETIKDLLNKLSPAIGAVIDVYDVVSALSSSSSFEEFAEKIKDKIASKAGEAFDAEKEVDDLKRIWDEYQKLKNEDLVERFFKDIPQCDQQLNGVWDKRTGKYLLTLTGDCKCKYPKNPNLQKFTVWIDGKITYQKSKSGAYYPEGSVGDIQKLEVVCKPCEKETSYLIRNEDELYAYFVDNQDSFKKSLDQLPGPMMDILKRQEIVQFAVYRKIPQAPPREESVLIALKDGTIDQIWKKYKPMEDTRKITLSVMMDDSTMRGIFNAPNKLEAIGAALEQDKVSLAGQTALNKVYLTMLLLGKEVSSSFRSGETYGALTPTKVYLVKQQNVDYNAVINPAGKQIGYGSAHMDTLLAYNSRSYSQSAGIYYDVSSPTVTTLGGYGVSGAFVLGSGTARNTGGYVYAW